MISFANPKFFWMLPASIVLTIVVYWFARLQQKKLQQWIATPLWPTVLPEYSKTVFRSKFITLGFCFFFLALALCRPQWGEKEETIQSEGMDILFAVDISNSMLAEDVTPSRLKRAQIFIRKTLALLPNDRAGIIAFAGSSYLAVPLTTDFGYISEVVESLDPSMIMNQGTEIGPALDVAMKAFERGAEDDHKTSRAIVLISDGEDFGKDAIKAAQTIRDFGTGFFTISVGSNEGAPIPLRNESGVLQTYKKDPSGKPVLSRVNKELLSKIAEEGTGKFIELVNPEDSAYNLARQLRTFTRSAQKDQKIITKTDRFQIFVGLAIFFLLLNLFIGYRSFKFFSLKPRALILLCLILFSSGAEAQSLNTYLKSRQGAKLYDDKDFEGSSKALEEARKDDPENATLLYNQGTALAKAKRNEESLYLLNEASKKALSQGDYETASRSLYNEGVTHLENKNMKEGYDRLTKSIEMAKISGQKDLEEKARDALYSAIDKQKQQSKQDKDSKSDPNSKDKSSGGGGGDGKNKDGKQDNENKDAPKNNKKKPPQEGGQRKFQSGTLSKDVAESIMDDLSDREKQLYQKRMKERKTKERNHDKDW